MYKGAPVSPGIVRAGAMGLVGEQPGGGKEEQAREMLAWKNKYMIPLIQNIYNRQIHRDRQVRHYLG